MKFSIDRDTLFEGLQRTQNVVEKKSTLPVLSNVLLTIKGSQLTLTATDMEVGISITLPLNNQMSVVDGALALSAKNLLDIVRELPNKPIFFEKGDNNWIQISCQKSIFNIVGLSASEFPKLPQFEGEKYIDVKVREVCEMIDKTIFSASTDETRYHLNGVYLEAKEGALLRMVATDGHRLAFIDRELVLKTSEASEFKDGIIIPTKGITELRRLLDKNSDAEVFQLSLNKNDLVVRFKNSVLFVRLIDGEYPDYEQVIPKSSAKKVAINRLNFLASLKRVSLFSNEKSRGVKVLIKSGVITLMSSNPDLGEAQEEVDLNYSGEEVAIGFNAKYIIDFLSVLDCEEVSLNFTDKLSAGIFRPEGRMDYTYVVMPMRI